MRTVSQENDKDTGPLYKERWFIALAGLLTLLIVIVWITSGSASNDAEFEASDTPSVAIEAEQPNESNHIGTETAPNVETIASMFPARQEAEKIAKAHAEAKWDTDYEMVRYTLDNQMEAYEWLVEQTEHVDIMHESVAKWGSDYEMVKYDYENQVEAFNGLQ